MTARELREKYLEFFQSKGHVVYRSAPLVPIDATGREDTSLMFTGAGMVQFKPFFRGIADPPNKRLTDVQKCMRTTDIDEVGDATHLTFFEMMGNFSFGDYFKKEAIAYSWEFMTSPKWLGLEPKRLAFTVHESDEESFRRWSEFVVEMGLQPDNRIFRLGEETNFWPAGAFSKGPPGPCGPNTEMFYWTPNDEPPPTSPYGVEEYLRDEKAGKWLEIWNDVFIQYEWRGRLSNPDRPSDGWEKEGMDPLPFQSVDTGMGLERTITALNGKPSVYDNDLFEPVFEALRKVEGRRPKVEISAIQAERIIADHIRAACFCIADGILSSNSGRGYVLRRLIRRAVLKGQRVLGIERPFLDKVYEGVSEALGGHYAELIERREVIVETLKNEEALFRRTLQSGSEILESHLENQAGGTLPGQIAFQLYDTYGFPLEVTQELCQEAGIKVDVDGFEEALKEAQERSKAAHSGDTVYGGVEVQIDLQILFSVSGKPGSQATPTIFTGYRETSTAATVVGVLPFGGEEPLIVLALDKSPFYAESGGQVSDTGRIRGEGIDFEVVDLIKQDCVIVHLAKPMGNDSENLVTIGGEELHKRFFGKSVIAEVDARRRRAIIRNHTATHLLHAALRGVLGKHVTQAGSLVAPDHLRFDFTHGKAMSPDERAEVERIVNEQVLAADPVRIHEDVPIAEAKSRGAMALFGEKYGDSVRMVEVENALGNGAFSIELCGGCHVGNTAEIGLFKIIHESSAASGVRRIEAVTGEGAYQWVLEQDRRLHEAATALKTSPAEVGAGIARLQEQLREEKRRIERLRSQQSSPSEAKTQQVGSVELAVELLDVGDVKEATLIADRLSEGQPNRVVLVALGGDEKATLIVKAGADAQSKGAHAGNLVRELAKMVGGGGGGGADFATAGGKDVPALAKALEAAPEILASQLKA